MTFRTSRFSSLFLALLLVKLALFLTCLILIVLFGLDVFGLYENGQSLLGLNMVWVVVGLFFVNAAMQIVWRIYGKPIERSNPN